MSKKADFRVICTIIQAQNCFIMFDNYLLQREALGTYGEYIFAKTCQQENNDVYALNFHASVLITQMRN